MQNIKKWMESSFLPWKKSMDSNLQKQKEFEGKLKNKAHDVKYIVALLLENKPEEAVHLWNSLGLEPELAWVRLDVRNDQLIMQSIQGEEFAISLGQMIDELQRLLAA